ncbi:hypothetical protein PHLGIDRAFT_87880 [Phlebiopsis gigantea 11061_1 CR5-6]|uniref:Uncharacterized protein n=1 Tax=Phlebiopsis gigantea (strain 11061_1 CR5-6) TaxID=745531 RepID=A0A0C3SCA9_PHLG1|nr:hypothetical protein PHLGIDRAFT_87880 [Phlebiopsis gigantea 11061_1 CR5-6]
MGKLRMKRTPEEQRAHDLRKARKAARKIKRRRDDDIDAVPESSAKRARTDNDQAGTAEDEYLFDIEVPYEPSHRAHKPDFDHIFAQAEEDRFREKMWGAFGDDERLDSVETQFNSYTHIPRRWRGGGMDKMDDEDNIDPQVMEDEDYAEWVRGNMWRRKHAAEFEEQERKKAEHAARREREQKIREETARMAKVEEEDRKRRRHDKERKRQTEARSQYETKWKDLLGGKVEEELRFEDIPWPLFVDSSRARSVHLLVEDITLDAVQTFLIPGARTADNSSANSDILKRERKEKLRETMLRFHPDKFEGRIMRHVVEDDKMKVREVAGLVTRVLNDLLASKTR